jgi:hypothetical protein
VFFGRVSQTLRKCYRMKHLAWHGVSISAALADPMQQQ